MLFQKICATKGGWDTLINDELMFEWYKWIEGTNSIGLRFKRCYLPPQEVDNLQIHTFFYASELAFAAVVYIRAEHDGKATVSLVASKSKIAPMSKTTIPRLELLGGLLAAKLWTNVYNTLKPSDTKISRSYFWGDSQDALAWIKNGDEVRYKQFVQNRVVKIHELTVDLPWNHVPGKENPADLPSRGINPSDLLDNEFWRNGPSWLAQSPESWPPLTENSAEPGEAREELKLSEIGSSSFLTEGVPRLAPDVVIDEKKYSSFVKLMRVTAYIQRFIRNVQSKENRIAGELQASEVQNAESLWISILQDRLIKDKKFPKLNPQLRIFHDEHGTLRSRAE